MRATGRVQIDRLLARWPTLGRLVRPACYGAVGLSGVVVNTAVLWTLVALLGLPLLVASVLATETAILNNFFLNDRWTFRSSGEHSSLVQRLLRFNAVSLGGMAINALLLMVLTYYAGLYLLIANLIAVGGAMCWNYMINSRWTWRGTKTDKREHGVVAEHEAVDARG